MKEELKQMIEPLKDWKYWKYSCTDEDVKKAMETKSYVEVIIEEQDKRINELQQELQRKDNIIKQTIGTIKDLIDDSEDTTCYEITNTVKKLLLGELKNSGVMNK